MSDSNIYTASIDKLDQLFNELGIQLLLHRLYSVGKGVDVEKITELNTLKRILCNRECLLDVDFDKVKELIYKELI